MRAVFAAAGAAALQVTSVIALPMRPDLMFADAGALVQVARSTSEWPGELLPIIQDQPRGSYLQLITPLVQAISITYRSSAGPEHLDGFENATVDGGRWVQLRELEADPHEGGIHARTFVDREDKRVIVAFRGICKVNAFRQCQVDKCFLQSFSALGSLSSVAYAAGTSCDQFASELDYVRQADEYVRRVQAALPDYDLLLTGHSLGGALAIVVSAVHGGKLKVVSFAPTAFHELLRKQGLSEAQIAKLPANDLIAIGDPYDCMINAVYVHSARQGATTCLLEDLQEPDTCKESMKQVAISSREMMDVAKLLQCKGDAHDWWRYEKLLVAASPSAAPQHLPTCSTAASVFQASE